MYKISLVNMPFSAAFRPSLGLMQLRSALNEKLLVDCSLYYANQDLACQIGVDLYSEIAEGEYYNAGLGDWLFRQLAFPWLSDNRDYYFRRYINQSSKSHQLLRDQILEARAGLETFLDEIIDKYQLASNDFVGLTSTFSQNNACFAVARKLKELNPEVIIAIGGANCEYPMGEEIAKHVEHIDFVFSGPGLRSFPELVNHLIEGEHEKCHEIDGVITQKNVTSVNPIGHDLPIGTKLTLCYDDFLDSFEDIFHKKDLLPSLTFETSRGCWWGERSHCTFCGLNGLTMNYRSMAPDQATEQFESLFKHADRIAGLECVDNIMPADYPQSVFSQLKTPSKLAIFYEVKANLTEEDIKVLSKARVKVIQPGIESLATSSLKLMKKGGTAFQNVSLLKHCVSHDVFPGWNILIGFPGEDVDVYKKCVNDIPLLTHLPPPINVFPVRFDRFSPYFQQAEKYGLDLTPCDFYALIYPYGDMVLKNLAYYFKDQNFDAEYQVFAANWINKIQQKVDSWLSRWLGNDGFPPAKLYLLKEAGQDYIHDSRSGEVLTYKINELALRILNCLDKPLSPSRLAKQLKDIDEGELELELNDLREKGLLFEERGRSLSLLLSQKPPSMSIKQVGTIPFAGLDEHA